MHSAIRDSPSSQSPHLWHWQRGPINSPGPQNGQGAHSGPDVAGGHEMDEELELEEDEEDEELELEDAEEDEELE